MIVVDSSALIAILEDEPEAESFSSLIAAVERPRLSAATLREAGIVIMNRRGSQGMKKLYALIDAGGFEGSPVTEDQARLALEALARYGKGHKSHARLNYGDCFSYALAKSTTLPLLFKGEDFSQTDVQSAL